MGLLQIIGELFCGPNYLNPTSRSIIKMIDKSIAADNARVFREGSSEDVKDMINSENARIKTTIRSKCKHCGKPIHMKHSKED